MSLAAVVREVPRHYSPTIAYMESDLAILNAAHYDIGVPLPALLDTASTRATRGTKRKLQTLLSERKSSTATTTNMLASSTAAPACTAPQDILSAVDVTPPTIGRLKARKPPITRSSGRAASSTNTAGEQTRGETRGQARGQAIIMGSDGDDDDDEEDDHGDGAEGDKKRARGRPRIDVKDVTAADRRRTQIRLAQRAYRSRKEKAIVSLEKRVHALKEANEAMSNAFMVLHDFAVQRGLLDTHPDLAQQLRQTTEVFLEMARQSSADEDMDDNEDEEQQQQQRQPMKGPLQSQTQTNPTDDAWAFRKKQQAITEAVKTFGYQTTQQQPQEATVAPTGTGTAAAVMSEETAIRQAQQIQQQLYGGVLVQHQPQQQQQQQQQHQNNTFDHQPQALFDNSFGLAMDILNSVSSVTTSPAVGAPLSSPFFSGSNSNSNTALSDSPMSGQQTNSNNNNNDFDAVMDGGSFSFDGPSFSLFPTAYPSPPGQDASAVPASTSDLGPHLADTDAFIATASIGSPFPGISLPTHIDIPNISFGLRLRRYALESAYRLISSPNPPSDIFARAFGFCIMFEPVDAIRQRLVRGLETPLSPNKFTHWELPFVTETPDPEEEPAPVPPSGASATSSVTSQTTQTSRSSRASRGSGLPNNSNGDHRGTGVRTVVPRINVTLPGFEGAFYDCDETEMYLQQRGVHIPPNSDSILVEVDDADFALDDATTVDSNVSGGPATSTSMSTAGTASTASTANTSQSGLDGSGSGSNSGSGNGSVGMFDYLAPDLISPKTGAASARAMTTSTAADAVDWNGTASAAPSSSSSSSRGGHGRVSGVTAPTQDGLMASFLGNSMLSFDGSMQLPSHVNIAFPRRRLLVLDVIKFLRELVRRGTCLGQTPGFRASDVNEAFRIATRDAAAM
ncbi:hypothetical protein SCUCBS95973_001017 [Sporothrix curviconia]|uniref:BZIP domain-containing protein n=1 Tax=Sporothrix curviconia TaxID=1260050 RepID=A0ABP0AV17_9PEZI